MTETDKPDAANHAGEAAMPIHGATIEGIARNETGQMVVHLKGRPEPVVDARVCRCFPWSLPDQYISIRDKGGKEVVLLRTLDEVPPEERALILEELQDKVFSPRIQRVVASKSEFGVTSITAMTDRGEVIFQVRSREDVRVLSSTRALFRDVDGNTFELADLTRLDKASQRYLAEYF